MEMTSCYRSRSRRGTGLSVRLRAFLIASALADSWLPTNARSRLGVRAAFVWLFSWLWAFSRFGGDSRLSLQAADASRRRSTFHRQSRIGKISVYEYNHLKHIVGNRRHVWMGNLWFSGWCLLQTDRFFQILILVTVGWLSICPSARFCLENRN